MSPSVHDLRNTIRRGVGRFERETSTQFTKEELAALANAVGYAVDIGAPPSKTQMRAGIRWRAGLSDSEESASTRPFVKDELETLVETLNVE